MKARIAKAVFGAIMGASVADSFYVMAPANGIPIYVMHLAAILLIAGGAWIGWTFRLSRSPRQPPMSDNAISD